MRRRLVVAIAGVAAVAVLALAVPLALVLQRSYRDEALLRLQRDAVSATRGIDLSPRPKDPVELPPADAALSVYDRAGRLRAGRAVAPAPAVARRVLRTARPADTAAGGEVVVGVPLLRGERLTGAVVARRADSDAVGDTRDAWLILAGIAAAIIAAAALAAVLLARRLARPLERLTIAARRLGHGDFTARAGSDGVAEVAAVGEALDATAGRLDDLITRERAFSTNASHQLRTPLAALRLELESLQLREPGAPESEAALAQVDRLETTIDTLLAVARHRGDTNARVDLGALLAQVESRWHAVLAADARPLRTRGVDSGSVARASEDVVNEIVDVLVDNAHRHGTGAITLGLRRVDAWWALEVADQGPGFADTDRTAHHDGHGIGLELARSLAHGEGGRVVVSSSGPGPVVTLMLAAE
jgi:signal transduction histidine kinase